jgi:hypothetical protein
MRRKKIMSEKVTIDKTKIDSLIGYIHTLLDFIDVEDFEQEENKELVRNGYDDFVKPVIQILHEHEEITE